MTFDAGAFRDELLRVFALNELEGCLSDEKVDLLTAFALRLAAENEKYNLTALSTPGDMILRHFADCAALIPHLPETGKALDVGCGAGFPSLVLAILCPTLSVTALDATEKKVRFVAGCADEFGIANLQTLIGRAETLAASVPFREAFDLVTARAVATSKLSRIAPYAASSARRCSARPSMSRTARVSCKNPTLLFKASSIVISRSPRTIFKGIAGKPAPLPTSTTEAPCGKYFSAMTLSMKCLRTTSLKSVMAVKLNFSFQEIRL